MRMGCGMLVLLFLAQLQEVCQKYSVSTWKDAAVHD